MVKARDLDISLRRMSKELFVHDINGKLCRIKITKSFLKHIQLYHSNSSSIHEEKGNYFYVNDSFRKKIEEILK